MRDLLSGDIVISEITLLSFDSLQQIVPKQTFATPYIFEEGGMKYTCEYQKIEY